MKRLEATASDFAPGMGIQLRGPPHAGRLVVPMWQKYKGGTWVMSDDNGKTWTLGDDVTAYGPGEKKRGINESQVVELADGRLLLTGRGWDGELYRKSSLSADGGQTWSRLADTPALIDPHSMASLVRLSDPLDHLRSRLLFSNPAHTKSRENGTLRLSYDEGATWPVSKVLVPEAFAYSCLARTPDGCIGCLYETRNRQGWCLGFARITMSWLTDGKDGGTE